MKGYCINIKENMTQNESAVFFFRRSLKSLRNCECLVFRGLKGKSSLMLYEQFGELKFKYRSRAFWR